MSDTTASAGTSGDDAQNRETLPLERPQRWYGPYLVVSKIGEGGMGVVYEGYDESLKRRVALKVMSEGTRTDPALVRRFKREAQAVASIDHPNVTKIFYTGQQGDAPFFAMELILGKPLDRIVAERGQLPAGEAMALVTQVSRGLRAALKKGIVHRDIKPSNVILNEEGTAKITDFGLARELNDDPSATATGCILGTPAYMAPEQAEGKPVDHRADIYSLGVTLFELVDGRVPFDGPSPVEILVAKTEKGPPRLANVPARVADLLAPILAKAIAPSPDARYADYDQLIGAIEEARRHLGGANAVPTVPSSAPTRAKPAAAPAVAAAKLPWKGILAGVLGTVVLALVLYYALRGKGRPTAGDTSSGSTPPSTADLLKRVLKADVEALAGNSCRVTYRFGSPDLLADWQLETAEGTAAQPKNWSIESGALVGTHGGILANRTQFVRTFEVECVVELGEDGPAVAALQIGDARNKQALNFVLSPNSIDAQLVQRGEDPFTRSLRRVSATFARGKPIQVDIRRDGENIKASADGQNLDVPLKDFNADFRMHRFLLDVARGRVRVTSVVLSGPIDRDWLLKSLGERR